MPCFVGSKYMRRFTKKFTLTILDVDEVVAGIDAALIACLSGAMAPLENRLLLFTIQCEVIEVLVAILEDHQLIIDNFLKSAGGARGLRSVFLCTP